MADEKVQFGIRGMMLYVIFSCVVLAICKALHIGVAFAAFSMIFMGIMLYFSAVMKSPASSDFVVLQKVESKESAELIVDFLRGKGIHATVGGENFVDLLGARLSGEVINVIVPRADKALADALVRERFGEE